MSRRPAGSSTVAVLEAFDRGAQEDSAGRTEPVVRVVELVRIADAVVVLALTVPVLDIGEGGCPQRVVGRRVTAATGLPVGVERRDVRSAVLDQRRIPPVRGRRAVPETEQAVPVDPAWDLSCRRSGRTSARGRCSATTASDRTFAGIPGPTTTKGTRTSVSNAVSFPGPSRYSPMWKPLSDVNTK